jgi:hypothetical protein
MNSVLERVKEKIGYTTANKTLAQAVTQDSYFNAWFRTSTQVRIAIIEVLSPTKEKIRNTK